MSAKYGVVDLDQIVEPYDATLIGMNRQDRQQWVGKTASQLKMKIGKTDILYFHAGKTLQGISDSIVG